MALTKRIALLLLATCATPEREVPPAPVAPTPSPAAAPRTPAADLCAKSSRRIAVTWEEKTAFLKLNELEATERVFYWSADVGAGAHAVAVSNAPPKECAILENCQALVFLDCGDGYVKLLGGASPSIRPEPNPARLDAGQLLDLISLEPVRDVPDMRVRTRWRLTDAPEAQHDEVDCPTVDASAPRLSDATATPLQEPTPTPMKRIDLQLGKRLPPMLLPGETFRVPLGPLATYNPLQAIVHVQRGASAGIVFTTGECVLNEWFYAFGGHGVELVLEPAPLVRGRNGVPRALLLVRALGENQRTLSDHLGASLATHRRDLVFAVDERRVTLAADTDAEPGERVMYTRLEQQQDQVFLLTTSPGGMQQRRRYDAKTGEFEPH